MPCKNVYVINALPHVSTMHSTSYQVCLLFPQNVHDLHLIGLNILQFNDQKLMLHLALRSQRL